MALVVLLVTARLARLGQESDHTSREAHRLVGALVSLAAGIVGCVCAIPLTSVVTDTSPALASSELRRKTGDGHDVHAVGPAVRVARRDDDRKERRGSHHIVVYLMCNVK